MINAARLSAVLLLATTPVAATELTISAAQIDRFKGAAIGERVDNLIWRGGISMVSQNDTFGGLSGMAFTSRNQHLSFVSDRGNFVSGQLIYEDATRLLGFIGVKIEPIQNSKGAPLPRQYSRDAEAIDTIYRDGQPAAVRVGFEHLTRVADFTLTDAVPGGAAREVPIPDWLTDTRTNESLEAVCIAPDASPIAGSTLLLTEGVRDNDGQHVAWLLGQRDKGPLTYRSSPDVNPTDCAFLPNGDLLVLERGLSFLTFSMTLRRVAAADVRPGNLMSGNILLEARGGDIDNMEAVAVHTAPDGELRIILGSDNNFNDWERNLLLEFALPPDPQ
ncbi:esterase-like activity of phytase family protein [Devosia algicola]|uniref:Esterase-like activity of phytase family protein n=1 Tax=Devosia algicola TaxID=3026418 RepID=A0ABY7YJP7_9HYPH|nr:esterase-like activity of phytase family protein [Devosia algicola]WDR01412.1 esterase-like activity of phytase family protein [Devosia algicola]